MAKKEARKLQKDIITKWLGNGSFNCLQWAIKGQALNTPDKLGAFRGWMLKQFDSRLVKSRISDPTVRAQAKQRFQQAARLVQLF